MNKIVVSTAYPVMTITEAIERRNLMVEVVQQLMKDGSDFGVIPGTGDKKTLLKPGAEKLCTVFGLSPRFVLLKEVEDWTGENHNGEPFFYYKYSCQLWRGDVLVADSEASANSWEKKYRFRNSERVCPYCGISAIIKGKAQYGGGWLCYRNKGGCGEKFTDNDPAITEQEVGRVANPDIADVVNTLQKMAQKRALVGTTLIAVNASEFFTQDVEDLAIIEVYPRYTDTGHVPPLESIEGQSSEVVEWATKEQRYSIGSLFAQAGFGKSSEVPDWLAEKGYDSKLLSANDAKQVIDLLTDEINREPTLDM